MSRFIKLLDHQGGACASSKEAASKQAASNKQASSAGPFLSPRATGVPKLKKNHHSIRDGFPQLFRKQLFFGSDVIGNGDLLGFWPVLGRGHVEKFKARAKNRKTQFPGGRGTFGEQIRPPQRFLPEIAQLFYILHFGRPDPQGRKIAKYGVSRPFWPRALGAYKNSGPKTEKHHFPVLEALLGENSVRPKSFSQKK